ncbi:MAG TPA: histidine kinase dimerization/phospho-acceptor domain-containing protein [Marmoricola sp.]
METVNHELRTPVAVVKGHVELLQESRDCLPPTAQWSLEAITRGVQRLETVLASIRELADRTARH